MPQKVECKLSIAELYNWNGPANKAMGAVFEETKIATFYDHVINLALPLIVDPIFEDRGPECRMDQVSVEIPTAIARHPDPASR